MSENRALTKPAHEIDIFARIDSADFKTQLARSIPNTLKADRVARLALTLLRATPALQKCDPISIMACVVESAQLGLELDNVLGYAYMVPLKGSAHLIVGYRGFLHLIHQSGVVSSVSAEIVRPGDEFRRVLGTRRELVHVPKPIPKGDNPDNWLGAYAAAEYMTGRTDFEYLERVQIEAARNRSQSWRAFKSDGRETPWNTDAGEMWKKTAIRRFAKRMPKETTDKRPALLRAVMLDEY